MRKTLLLLTMGCALLCGCGHTVDKDDKKPAEAASTNASAAEAQPGVVSLSPDAQQRIGLKVAAVAAAQQPPIMKAFGTVLDPAPLVALQGDLTLAEATLGVSEANLTRAKNLYEQAQNVSRKSVESAESDVNADEIKVRNLLLNLQLDWGSAMGKMDSSSRQELINSLAAHTVVLARVDLPAGEVVTNNPTGATVFTFGQKHGRSAVLFSVAGKADPRTLGQGFILRVDDPQGNLAVGAPVTAHLFLPGASQSGVAVPESAVVWSSGRTWVYLPGADNKFTRREITLGDMLDVGWFVQNGLTNGEVVVVNPPAILLSEEQKSELKTD